ncbi:MAG: hypothetical protein U0235_32760 [Polyangiaceae bacterium]
MAGMIPRIARAEGAAATTTPRPSEGTVIALDSGDLVLDIGAAKGLHDGDLVELWRPLRVRHPVTGQMLVDRFRIGTVKLTQVQKTMSLGHVEGDALRAPAAGDAVRTTVPEPLPQRDAEAVYPTPGPTRIAAPAPSCAPSDPEAEELSRLFTALRGAAPEARVAAYQTFVRARPKSRFAAQCSPRRPTRSDPRSAKARRSPPPPDLTRSLRIHRSGCGRASCNRSRSSSIVASWAASSTCAARAPRATDPSRCARWARTTSRARCLATRSTTAARSTSSKAS